VATANPHARRLAALGSLDVAPKQAWTPVAEFGLFGLDAINFGPGAPGQAHQRDEFVEGAALVRSYELLESFA
jgi:succinyl-diaminopimelate desuccinylase